MNGKQAKRLRKAAIGLATTLSEAGKDIKKDGYQVKKHEKHLSPSSLLDEHMNGAMGTASYQLLVRPDSAKGIYKQLKNGKIQ